MVITIKLKYHVINFHIIDHLRTSLHEIGVIYVKRVYFLRCIAWETLCMMTSSNGSIFRVTGHLCGDSSVTAGFPTERLVTQSVDVFFGLRLNKQLSKQSSSWWFETPSRTLWRQCNGILNCPVPVEYDACMYTAMPHMRFMTYQIADDTTVCSTACLTLPKKTIEVNYCPLCKENHRSPMDSPDKKPLIKAFHTMPSKWAKRWWMEVFHSGKTYL